MYSKPTGLPIAMPSTQYTTPTPIARGGGGEPHHAPPPQQLGRWVADNLAGMTGENRVSSASLLGVSDLVSQMV